MITRRHLMFASLAALFPKPLLALSCAAAPDLTGAGPWINSAPLSLAKLFSGGDGGP